MKSIIRWFQFRRECAWHHGYMGGNPFSRRVTHGICEACLEKFLEPDMNFERVSLSVPGLDVNQFGKLKQKN